MEKASLLKSNWSHHATRPDANPTAAQPVPDTIGERIAKRRKLKGMTQVELAQRIGIERSVIANYEKGRLRIYDEMLARIALALETSTDELLGLSKPVAMNAASLRIMKRVLKIEQLAPAKQKAILQTLDMALQSVVNDSD